MPRYTRLGISIAMKGVVSPDMAKVLVTVENNI